LPHGATSLSLNIENSTYSANLDQDLKRELTKQLTGNQVSIVPATRSDLSLQIQLTSANNLRQEISIYQGQTFRFLFQLQVIINLKDNRSGESVISDLPITGQYSEETNATELDTEAIRYAQGKAILALSEQIRSRLMQDF